VTKAAAMLLFATLVPAVALAQSIGGGLGWQQRAEDEQHWLAEESQRRADEQQLRNEMSRQQEEFDARMRYDRSLRGY